MQSPKQKPLNWTRNGDKHNQAHIFISRKKQNPIKTQ